MPEKQTDYRKHCVRLSVLLTVAALLLIAAAALFVALYKELPVIEAMRYIRVAYYDYDDQHPETVTDEALRAIAYSLNDDYSEYYSHEEYNDYEKTKSGSYIGIGIVLMQDESGRISITNVYNGSPADKAGILPGDMLFSVDGKNVTALTLNEALSEFDIDSGREISLELMRNGAFLEVAVTPSKVSVPYVTVEMLNEKTGFMRITEFSGNAASEAEIGVSELLKQGMERLIIDLRDNPGGDFDICLKISSFFLKKGSTIVSTRSRQNEEKFYYSEKEGMQIPTIILINGSTASAAELMTAALHDNGRATVIGTRSYGKGIVQTIFPLLSNGGRIKFTTDKYFSPDGKCIHGEGIEPDILISIESEGAQADVSGLDLYLSEAIKYFESVLE